MAYESGDGMLLPSGQVFSFDNPSACKLTIEDIAVPISNVCRYAGQVPLGRWYSVAQHAVNTSRIVAPEYAYDALMHDTAEAFTNDVPTPLKRKVPLFKEIEVRVETDIARRFGATYPLSPAIILADAQMLALEMKYIRGDDVSDHRHLDGIEFEHLLPLVDLSSWNPQLAYVRFMDRYKELRYGR